MAKAEKKQKNALISYFEASYEELRKVAWPTRNRAIRVTFLVLGFVVVIALIIGVLDFVFGLGQRALLDLAPDRALPTVHTTQPAENPIDIGDVSVTTDTGESLSVDVMPLDETPVDETPTEEAPATETPPEETSS